MLGSSVSLYATRDGTKTKKADKSTTYLLSTGRCTKSLTRPTNPWTTSRFNLSVCMQQKMDEPPHPPAAQCGWLGSCFVPVHFSSDDFWIFANILDFHQIWILQTHIYGHVMMRGNIEVSTVIAAPNGQSLHTRSDSPPQSAQILPPRRRRRQRRCRPEPRLK